MELNVALALAVLLLIASLLAAALGYWRER